MLTQRQAQLLDFLDTSIQQNGVCPSYNEMCDAVGLASKSNLHRIISALEERGFVRRLKFRARAIEVIKRPGKASVGAVNEDFERGYEAGYIKGFDDGVAFVEGGKK